MGSFVSNALGTNNGFNAVNAAGTSPFIDRQNLAPQIATANQNVQGNIANQNAFAQTLQNQIQGNGPSLANQQLANATGQNVSNQAALMAGQRGAGSNAGLIARQAAEQGAKIQQTSAGQAAANRAQEQLSAQTQLGNVYGNIGSESGQNLATQQGAQTGQNAAIVNATNSSNNINAQTAAANTATNAGITGGILNSISSGISMAKGGEVQKFDSGGMPQTDINNSMFAVPPPSSVPSAGDSSGQPRSALGQNLASSVGSSLSDSGGGGGGGDSTVANAAATGTSIGQSIGDIFGGGAAKKEVGSVMGSMGGGGGGGSSSGGGGGGGISSMLPMLAMLAAKGGKVPALVSPGEIFVKPDKVKEVAKGKVDPTKIGEKIPGKPKVPGAIDSYKNDTVPKALDSGGVVIPRHITQGKNPVTDSIKFVKATLQKKRQGVK